jgi:hypothetical protein
MDGQSVNDFPPAAAHDGTVRWGCNWKGLLELVEKIRLRVAREAKRPVDWAISTRFHRVSPTYALAGYLVPCEGSPSVAQRT